MSISVSIEIWFLQIGEQIINREAVSKRLQGLTDFFDNS